jgi:DNA helicase-2/ATP-dependent DNA helicase PcrA
MPYRVVGGVRFYERKEIKDVLAYLQLLHNALDVQALQRIINVPRRGIGGKTLETLFTESARANTSPVEYLLKNKASITPPTLQKFAKLLEQLFSATAELNIVELINFVLNKTEYIEMLDDGTTENEARIENLKELITVASKYAEFSPAAGLMTFLEEVALIENSSQQGEDGSAVTLMTIHAAKGLEFRTVFVVGVEEGLFPHSRVYDNPSELEEERRLAYVAITRAKRTLHLVHADSRIYFGSRQQNMRSRFIDDIPEKLVKFKGFSGREDWLEGADDKEDEWSQSFQPVELTKGLKVKHNYFGVGRVVDFNESIVKIDFGPIYGTKELARDLAPIQPI